MFKTEVVKSDEPAHKLCFYDKKRLKIGAYFVMNGKRLTIVFAWEVSPCRFIVGLCCSVISYKFHTRMKKTALWVKVSVE